MPVGRRPFEIAELAPASLTTRPTSDRWPIGGAFAFDSIFLIDGVDTNDNLFGTSNNLFVEDAIEETQVLIAASPPSTAASAAAWSTSSPRAAATSSRRVTAPTCRDRRGRMKRRSRRTLRAAQSCCQSHEGTIGGPIVLNRCGSSMPTGTRTSTTSENLRRVRRRRTARHEEQARRAEADRQPDRPHGQRQLPEQPHREHQSAPPSIRRCR